MTRQIYWLGGLSVLALGLVALAGAPFADADGAVPDNETAMIRGGVYCTSYQSAGGCNLSTVAGCGLFNSWVPLSSTGGNKHDQGYYCNSGNTGCGSYNSPMPGCT